MNNWSASHGKKLKDINLQYTCSSIRSDAIEQALNGQDSSTER